MEILSDLLSSTDGVGADGRPGAGLYLSAALNLLAQREQYLALEQRGMRLDIGVKYGLLTAQIALALNGQDRDEMLTRAAGTADGPLDARGGGAVQVFRGQRSAYCGVKSPDSRT